MLLIPLVLGLLGLAGYSSCLRVTNGNASLEGEYEDDLVESLTDGKLGDYSFLVRFGVELGGRPSDERMLEQGVRDTIIMPPEMATRVRFWCCWDRRYGCFGSYPSASEQSEDEADTQNVVDIDIDIDIGRNFEQSPLNSSSKWYQAYRNMENV